MRPHLIHVKALPNYKIFLSFDDGVEGEVSLEHLKDKGIFQCWNENDNFMKVYINEETNAVSWNEDVDLDTLNLYLKLRDIDFKEWKQQNKVTYASN